jgi:Uncharacterized protein conserved in bacteria (DUF2334)
VTKRNTSRLLLAAILSGLLLPAPALGAGPTADRVLLVNQESSSYPQTAELRGLGLQRLLQHFTPRVEQITDRDYHSGELAGFDKAVIVGNDASSPLSSELLADLSDKQLPVLWVGYGLSRLVSDGEYGQRFGFVPGYWTSDETPTTLSYQGHNYPVDVPDYSQVRLIQGISGKILLDESFGEHALAWPNQPSGVTSREAQGAYGTYHLRPRATGQFVAVTAPLAAETPDDFIVSAIFRKAGGPPGGGFGLIVHQQSPDILDGRDQSGRYQVVEVGDLGEIGVWRREQEKWVELQEWTPSNAVHSGLAENELTVEVSGPRMRIYVNGVEAATIEDNVLRGGMVGLFAGGDGNDVEVSRVRVQAGLMASDTAATPEVLATYADQAFATPYVVRGGNLWYVNGLPDFQANVGPKATPMLVVADVLHEFFGSDGHTGLRQALVRVTGVGPTTDPQRVRAVAAYLAQQRVPFEIEVDLGVASHDIPLSARPDLVEALRQAQAWGGVVGMRLFDGRDAQSSLDLSRRLRLNPRLAIGPEEGPFSHVIGSSAAGAPGLPYPSADPQRVMIPTNLTDPSLSVRDQLARAADLLVVRDAWAVAAFDISQSPGDLTTLVDGLRTMGYPFLDLRKERLVVRASSGGNLVEWLGTWIAVDGALSYKRFDRTLERVPGWVFVRGLPWPVLIQVALVLAFLLRLREQWRPVSGAEAQSHVEPPTGAASRSVRCAGG